MKRELGLFAINGLVSVGISFWVYLALADNGMQLYLASGVGYVAGMAYGFFANKSLTFGNKEEIRLRKVVIYCVLYLATLLINMSANVLMLAILADFTIRIQLAFFVAISLSTVLNFLGLKYFVFSKKFKEIATVE